MTISRAPELATVADQATRRLGQLYLDVRRTTEALCAPLSADDQMVQSIPDASPAKWHQAHTTWFFETFILTPQVARYRPLDPRYRFLFNSYYKQVESGETSSAHPLRAIRGTFSRPTLEQIQEYRRHVDGAMLRLLESDCNDELASLVTLGINHEQQHQELILTDIKHAFWTNPLRPAYLTQNLNEADSPDGFLGQRLNWVEHDGGLHSTGHQGNGFAFDNEGPRHQVYLEPFRIAARAVTNGEYMAFMDDGGYRRPELWLSDGWDAVQAHCWNAPLYWERQDGAWVAFTLGGTRKVVEDEPVTHVSLYEADAYARWAGARLPREAEWEVVATGSPIRGTFLEHGRYHPAPLDSSTIPQMFGDVWEWTSSPYSAYPGYRPPAGALGEYNSKFMCSQLVLRGGSCATPRSHIRASYRNFFAPQARWQFSGIRLANDCI